MTTADDTERNLLSSWPDRLRSSAIILLVAGLLICGLVFFGDLTPLRGAVVLIGILVAALIPWRLAVPVLKQLDRPDSLRGEAPVLSAVIASLPDPSMLLDRAGRVLHHNQGVLEIAPALRRNELAQFALRSPEIVTALRESIALTEVRRTTYVDHGPLDRWLEVVITPVQIPTAFDGRDCWMLVTFHDLTKVRRVEEMRVDFVANASHELRTPLAALSGFIDTLQGPAKDDAKARERFLSIMHTQAARMGRLIDDLLSLSRVELTAHVRPVTPIDLVPVIRQVEDGFEMLSKERGVKLTVNLPDEPQVICGDRDELLRVYVNLIENAMKYGEAGKEVVVTVEPQVSDAGKQEVKVSVRDFGAGIPPEHLPRLTERFYRVNTGASRAQGGTGLGLALVKHIVGRHGGRLLIESVYGQGATFATVFPAQVSAVQK